MSGHDETFLPPDGEDAKLPPHPPTPAPPHFGQASAGEPSVAFQTADTQPGNQVFSGASVASDDEETMTPPLPKRPGGPTPDVQNPATAPYGTAPRNGDPVTPSEAARRPIDFPPPPLGPLASNARSADAERTITHGPGARDDAYGTFAPGTPPYATPVSSVPPYGSPAPDDPLPEAERTVADASGPSTERTSPVGRHAATPPYGNPGGGPVPGAGTSGTPPYAAPVRGSDGEPASSHAEPSATPPYGGSGANGFAEPNAEHAATEEPTAAHAPSPGMPEAGGQPVGFANGHMTLAVARFGSDAPSGTPGPALTPDAILPPGTPPQAPPEPPAPDPSATSTGPIPRLGAGASFPGGPGSPPSGGSGGSSAARRALLVGGGLVGALLLGGGGALAVTTLSGGSHKEHKVAQAPPPAPASVRPTPTPSKAKHKPKPVPVDIRDEKKDPKPLTITEVFPARKLTLAGHKFVLAKTVINDHCSLAANGPFAQELTREHCRRIVRATFVSDDKKLAVTTGIAVMPTDAAARAALKAQDPSHYKWFRGMKATGAPKIDQAGGFAASTLRGRYISYAYATYADGHKPAAKDNTLKTVGTAFRDSTARPIERRAKR
jgi:hypothetical protein